MKHGAFALLLGLAAIAAFLTLGVLRGSLGRGSGDEGTYRAMAESVGRDGDLRFGPEDRARLESIEPPELQVVILQRAADGRISYSKPGLYALLAGPFQRFGGTPGLLVLNALLLAAALLLAFSWLCRRAPPGVAALTVVGFAGLSALPAYIAWSMSDALQAALSLAGLVLALGGLRPRTRGRPGRLDRLLDTSRGPAVGGLLLGLLAFTRYPNGLVAVTAVAALLISRRPRSAGAVAAAALAAFVLVSGGNLLATGAAVPYKAERASFDAATGYPAGEGSEAALGQFQAGRATHSLGVVPRGEPVVTLYSSLYFLIGRHTGLLVYFPAAALLVLAALRTRDRLAWWMLAGAVAGAGFYLVWMPRNYFGGEGFIGNRYFLAFYPLLLVAVDRLPGRRAWLGIGLWAAVVFASAVVSQETAGNLDPSSQGHAHRGLFRLLPYESTASAIDGRRDRYWSDEFLRFVDPWARVGEWSFLLDAGDVAAEVMVASQRPHGAMRFVVHSDAPEILVEFRDWRRRTVERLSSSVGGVNGQVRFLPSPAWRRHPFWWERGDPFYARTFRVSVRTPDGRPARAELRYLGPYRVPSRIFARSVLAVELPERATAGTLQRLAVSVRNDGRRFWASDRVLSVFLSYRLVDLDHPGRVLEGRRTPLPERVYPGQATTGFAEVRWPDEPGHYRLVVDLVLEGVTWFAEQNGEPLAEGVVTVEPAGAEDEAAQEESAPGLESAGNGPVTSGTSAGAGVR